MRTVVKLTEIDGNVMVPVPTEFLDQLGIKAGHSVGVSVGIRGISIWSLDKPRYTAEELIAQCDFSIEMSDEEKEWMDAPPVGREIF